MPKKTTHSIAATSAVAALAAGMLAGGVAPAHAAVDTSDFTNVAVDNRGDLNGDMLISINERIYQQFTYTIPDSMQPGESFIMDWNDPFSPLFSGNLILTDASGTPIMEGKIVNIEGQKNQGVQFTLLDTAAGLQDRSVSAEIPLIWASYAWTAEVAGTRQILTYIDDQQIFAGDSYNFRRVQPTTWTNGGSNPNAAVPGTATINWYGQASASDQQRDVTFTFTRTSDNWKYDPSKVSFRMVATDPDGFVRDNPETPENEFSDYGWEFNARDRAEIVSATEDEVVVVLRDVPAGHAAWVSLNGGVASIDGENYTYTAVIDSDGSIRDDEPINARVASATVSGLGEGEKIAPSFTVESAVAGKDADLEKDAHKATLPNGATSTKLPYTVTVTNTGNIPLGSPTLTNGVGYSKTFFDVSIPVGGTHTFEVGELDTPLGTTTWNWEVTSNGFKAADPTVTVLAEQKIGDVVAKFVDTDGKDVKAPVTVADDANVGAAYDSTKNKVQTIPGDGFRYELVKVTGAETGKVVEGTTTITYTYQKVANWVPTIPGMDLPAIPYPFTPDGGVGEGVIPHVDGFVPVDPVTGEPLKPVDPEDPTKGYIAPKPGNPGENTVISYIPVGTPDEFSTTQGEPVTVVPADNDGDGITVGGLVDPKTGEKVTEVTVPGEGTYTLGEDGSVVFTPEEGFTGKTTPIQYIPVKDGVEGKPVDINGFVKPVASPDEFTTEEGKSVTIVPSDNDGKNTKPGSLIDPKTGEKTKEVTVPGEGTYLLNEDGSITFTPEDGFTGKTTPIQYVPVNEAGDEGEPVEITGEVTPAPVVEEPKVEEPAAPAPTIEQIVSVPSTPAAPAPVVKQAVEVQTPAQAPAQQATSQQAAPAKLAHTGAEVGVLAGIGGMLAAAGAFLARRRKNQG